jgi:hypothetical protein
MKKTTMKYFFLILMPFLLINFSCHKEKVIDLDLKSKISKYNLVIDNFRLRALKGKVIDTVEFDQQLLTDTLIDKSLVPLKKYLDKVNYRYPVENFFYVVVGQKMIRGLDTFNLAVYPDSLNGKQGVIFTDKVEVNNCVFRDYRNRGTGIEWYIFDSVLQIHDCEIIQGISVYNSVFKSDINFSNNKITYRPDTVDFFGEHLILRNFELLFGNSIFEKNITICSVKNIRDESYNQENEDIIDNIGFRNNYLNSVAFLKCIFFGKLDISNSIFGANATLEFNQTFLPDTLDLSNTKFSMKVDLTKTYPCIEGGKCEINLLNTDIEQIQMLYQNFHLFIPDSLKNNSESKDIISNEYESLLNNFKKHGFVDSYEKLDIEYKEWQGKNDWTLRLSNIWWKYGYEKWRILIATFVFIFLFSIFNYRHFKKLQIVYPVEKLNNNFIYYSRSRFWAFTKKYFAVLLYTGFIFFRLSIDFKILNFKPFKFVAILIAQYTIGLICTGFLVNWILKG